MLTPTEFRILAVLLLRPGQTAVRREALVDAGWPRGARLQENTLDASMTRVRGKLRALPDGREIATVHGVGYRIR